jgi:drug/metabolite transporter (DMT)-like permease
MSESTTKATVSSSPRSGPDQLTLAAFAAFILIGGSAAIGVLVTYRELAPFWSATLRFTMAAFLFWLLVFSRGVPLPRGRALTGAVLFGILGVGGAFAFFYYGLTRTPASLVQTIFAVVPLLTLLFAAAHKLEPITKSGVAGGLLAVAGIAIAVSGQFFSGVTLSLAHVLAVVLAAACFAEAGVVMKLFPHCHPYATNAIAMTIGAVMLAATSLIAGEAWALPSQSTTWLALFFLVAAVAGNFLIYLFILGRWTASGASYGFVLAPFVTMVLAAFFLDEAISPLFLLGAVVVIAGVYIGALRPSGKPAEPPSEAPPVSEDIHYRPGVPHCS